MNDFRTHDSSSAVDDEPVDSKDSPFKAFDATLSVATEKGIALSGLRVRAKTAKQALDAFVAMIDEPMLESVDRRHPITIDLRQVL